MNICSNDVVLMTILITLAAHCIGDFSLQTEFLSKYKSSNNFVLFVHCIIYTAICVLGFAFCSSLYGYDVFEFKFILFFLLVSHFAIDKFKCVMIHDVEVKFDDKEKDSTIAILFYVDQIMHLLILTVILLHMYETSPFANM